MAKAEYRSAVRSRKLIKVALADLLQEKPLDKITVTDVVKRAEINRGTFYAHYTDIPDVIHHLIQETFSNIQEVFSQEPKSISDVPHLLLTEVQRLLTEDLDLYRKIMSSGAAALMQEQLVNVVLEYLLQHEADFYSGDHEHFALIIRFCAGGLSNLYRDWFAGKLTMTLEELTREAEKLLGNVIATFIAEACTDKV